MDVDLQKAHCVGLLCRLGLLSTFRVSINCYLVCSLPIHKICALCGIFSAIFVLLTAEKSDDLEILVPGWSRSLKITPANSSRVINCTRTRILFLYRLWDVAVDRSTIALFATPLAFNASTDRLPKFPGTISVKFCKEVRGWPRDTAAKKYIAKSFNPLSTVHERYRQATNGFASKYPNVT